MQNNIDGLSQIDFRAYRLMSAQTRKAGISMEELDLLDAATQQAASNIAAMNEILDKGLARSERFFEEIAQLKDRA